MASHLRTEPVLDAPDAAVAQRRPRDAIRHPDRGSQRSSPGVGGRREAGVRPSLGPVGDAHDNAMGESSLATLECERPARRRSSQAEARRAAFGFVKGWPNPLRPRPALRYRSPIASEQPMQKVAMAP